MLHPEGGEKYATEAGLHYSRLIPKHIMEDLLVLRKFKSVQEKHISELIKANLIGASKVQAIMDEIGISNQGYNNLYKCMSSKGKMKKVCLLPKPMWVNTRRHEVNTEVLNKLGIPFHIHATFNAKDREVVFNEHTNIFFDLEALQRYAVQFFSVTTAECCGVLKFVLKLDECELLKCKKMERVTITLMNRALDSSITKKDARFFSVQSENNILPLGSFQVPYVLYS